MNFTTLCTPNPLYLTDHIWSYTHYSLTILFSFLFEVDLKEKFYLPWKDKIRDHESVPRCVLKEVITPATIVHKDHH